MNFSLKQGYYGFGKFSRTWKVLENEGYSNGYGNVMDFCLGKFKVS